MRGVEDKIMILFKTNTKCKATRVKNVYGGEKRARTLKTKKLSKHKNIKNIRNFRRLKKENEAGKDIIIRDIKNLFEQE